MNSKEKVVLAALKRDLKRLSKAAEKAKAECDEYLNVGSEMAAIHEEFALIVKAKETGPEVLKKLEALKRRRDKAERIMKKDLVKLLDKQHEAEFAEESLGEEIQAMEFNINLRARKA